mmetsp:Transcript_1477/g.3196  ORF Transcript_1477/g.3196 Transcript_1477/m.3196 type:complete len:253 (+) Transcript_1477:149-907(+)
MKHTAGIRGNVRHLPCHDAPLRMRHHREMAPILAAHRGGSKRASVWVVGVRLRRLARRWVGVPKWRARAVEVVIRTAGCEELPLPVGNPNTADRSVQALQHDRVGVLAVHHNGREAALEALRPIVNEARLHLIVIATAGRGNPPEQCHELASVAHAKAPRVVACAEAVKLRSNGIVEADRTRPALSGVEHIRVAEPSDENDTPEVVEASTPFDEIRRGHVPRLHTRGVHRGAHLAVAVAALLAQDADANLVI